MRLLGIAITIGVALGAAAPRTELGLDNCVDQFPGGTIEHAPRARASPRSTPPRVMFTPASAPARHRFFALEYDPERLAPICVAYRLTGTFGPDRSGSVARDHMRR